MGKPRVKKPKRKTKPKAGENRKQRPVAQARTQSNHFESLPNEMVDHILNFLPLEDKKSGRLVCSHWYLTLNSTVQFKMPLKMETLTELRWRHYEINELDVVLNRVTIPQSSHFTRTMKSSFLSTKVLSFSADDYAYPDGIDVRSNSFDSEAVMALIKACRNIHTLKFNFRFLDTFTMTSPLRLNNIQLEHLKTLQFKFAYGGQHEVSIPLLQLKTPLLQNLEVERFKIEGKKGTGADIKLYMVLQKFMGKNKGTLKSVKMANGLTNFSPLVTRPSLFPADILLDLSQLKLDRLEIQDRDSVLLRGDLDLEDWSAANSILNNQRFLKELKLDIVSPDIIQKSHHLLIRSMHTLTKLDINIKGAPELDFSTILLRFLTSLTHFTFTSNRRLNPASVFPRSIKYLTWNAPIHVKWYWLNPRIVFPSLVNLTIGLPGLNYLLLSAFCHSLFGFSEFNRNAPNNRSNLQLLILDREAQRSGAVETRSQSRYRNRDVTAALRLRSSIFNVVHYPETILIRIQSGIPV